MNGTAFVSFALLWLFTLSVMLGSRAGDDRINERLNQCECAAEDLLGAAVEALEKAEGKP